MFNIVLVSPKIPQNTGTIGRTCVSLGAKLHIVKPIPFSLDEKAVRRAGLDYWQDLDLTVWESLEEFLKVNPINERHFFATTKTKHEYFNVEYEKDDFIYFGSEDTGLPESLFQTEGVMINIPMKTQYRSLNQSNAVSIIIYEALRQNYSNFNLS
ncbi:MAG: tRNA (cytidine(34)-2'-O)-methyltransferase [Campylobacterales bacterium]|nr:tRNA (cytidine(34)-2'-O)-methyltransferase [Campylobacterales bacterium]